MVGSKLLSKFYRRFEILYVDDTTVTIEQNGISNKFSPDELTKVPLKTGTEEEDG